MVKSLKTIEEKNYFKKMFIDHVETGRHFELLVNNKVRKNISYKNLWIEHLQHYYIYYGQIDCMLVNPQSDYRLNEISKKSIQKKIFQTPLNGLDYLKLLSKDNIYRDTFGRLKVEKISVAAADISSNPVANPTVIFDEVQRIHPGKNLVSAHQVLKLNLNVIINYRKKQKINLPMLHKTPINSLKEFASKFKNIPMIFPEENHWHTFCLHKDWDTFDTNGYNRPTRKFDTNRFLEIIRNTIDSNQTFTVTNLAGKNIEIPNTYNTKQLRKLFKKVYNADCFLD